MSNPTKTTSLQTYHMLVFRKALHPEFFGIEGRSRIKHEDYDAESWIFRGGHAVRVQHNGLCVVEVVLEQVDQIPDRGLVATLPCAGERDHDEKFGESLVYMTTIQTETLSDHLYMGTYKEMLQHARESDSLCSMWTDEIGKPNLSVLDVQSSRTEMHIQGYHLRSDCGLVLRTQSMFQLTSGQEKDGKGRGDKAARGAARAVARPVRAGDDLD
ncbi:MAG: hypothetical protein JNM94_06285 [Phycisphaerae bacterium]|nr:hypothetical protein [Phycisphaerae bacterium]